MKKFYKKLTSLLLSCVLVFSSVTTVSAADLSGFMSTLLIDAAISSVEANYKFGIDAQSLYKNALGEIIAEHPELLETALKGIYDNLDKYSQYMAEEEWRKFVDDLSGEFCGIGVTIMEFENGLMVTEVHKNSPAETAGVKVGDIIISADGVDIRGLAVEKAREYIIGVEGTKVNIGVERGGEALNFDIVRGKVTVEPGFYQLLEGNVGYIQLSSFDGQSALFMRDALAALKDTKSIILDLRYNPGGALEILQEIASMTLPKGPVMHLEYKSGESVSLENETDGFKNKFVVLVNEGTASAAEAFSAAVQDYNIGVVVGAQTVGKGTMQIVNQLLNGGGYRLTVAEYLSPEKRVINGIGVEPDYKVEPEVVKYSDIYFDEITYERVLKLGDEGDDVLAMEQRLSLFGYSIGIPDKVFDEDTFYAVKKYQEVSGLYPYGVLDITTQLSIHNYLQDKDIALDKAFDKAFEIASGDIDAYIKEAAKERKALK